MKKTAKPFRLESEKKKKIQHIDDPENRTSRLLKPELENLKYTLALIYLRERARHFSLLSLSKKERAA